MSPEPSWRYSVDRCGIYGSRCWPNVLISLLSNAGCSRPGHMRTDRQSTQLRPAATGHNRSSRACIQGSSCCDIPLTGKIRLLVDVRLSRCGSQFCRATICIRWRPDILHRAFEPSQVQHTSVLSIVACLWSLCLIIIPRGLGGPHAMQMGRTNGEAKQYQGCMTSAAPDAAVLKPP